MRRSLRAAVELASRYALADMARELGGDLMVTRSFASAAERSGRKVGDSVVASAGPRAIAPDPSIYERREMGSVEARPAGIS
jgi:hypothetical protein